MESSIEHFQETSEIPSGMCRVGCISRTHSGPQVPSFEKGLALDYFCRPCWNNPNTSDFFIACRFVCESQDTALLQKRVHERGPGLDVFAFAIRPWALGGRVVCRDGRGMWWARNGSTDTGRGGSRGDVEIVWLKLLTCVVPGRDQQRLRTRKRC